MSSYPEGNFGGNQLLVWFDESFAPINKFEDRFARQNPFEPPPEFPLASPYSFIDHHLSGLSIYTFTPPFQHLVFLLVLFGSQHFLGVFDSIIIYFHYILKISNR